MDVLNAFGIIGQVFASGVSWIMSMFNSTGTWSIYFNTLISCVAISLIFKVTMPVVGGLVQERIRDNIDARHPRVTESDTESESFTYSTSYDGGARSSWGGFRNSSSRSTKSYGNSHTKTTRRGYRR